MTSQCWLTRSVTHGHTDKIWRFFRVNNNRQWPSFKNVVYKLSYKSPVTWCRCNNKRAAWVGIYQFPAGMQCDIPHLIYMQCSGIAITLSKIPGPGLYPSQQHAPIFHQVIFKLAFHAVAFPVILSHHKYIWLAHRYCPNPNISLVPVVPFHLSVRFLQWPYMPPIWTRTCPYGWVTMAQL